MRYLIDTHVLLWAIGKSDRLSLKARTILTKNTIYVSSASWWEISIKYSVGKLKLENATPEDLWHAALGMEFITLPISGTEANSFYKLDMTNKDPFDRMLIWQSIKNSLPIVSTDNRFRDYEKFGLQLIW